VPLLRSAIVVASCTSENNCIARRPPEVPECGNSLSGFLGIDLLVCGNPQSDGTLEPHTGGWSAIKEMLSTLCGLCVVRSVRSFPSYLPNIGQPPEIQPRANRSEMSLRMFVHAQTAFSIRAWVHGIRVYNGKIRPGDQSTSAVRFLLTLGSTIQHRVSRNRRRSWVFVGEDDALAQLRSPTDVRAASRSPAPFLSLELFSTDHLLLRMRRGRLAQAGDLGPAFLRILPLLCWRERRSTGLRGGSASIPSGF